ncbi:hypothetical protein [Williamsia sp. CHRR-6]|uniref:hypothetical protein n=1 Tax=Williamsia sp. CHRR-6 TaxID=2835871 RepID=UPI001BD9A02A|nr:hypothetical protein [Williamsia sp. CHRR-6]MBT0565950.1 hypothetical protein [Williamsia sp. CHRR-6]
MASHDLIRESARSGRVVIWEESARDGAQAKTLMSSAFRVQLACEMGAMFGANGARHVVFAAGFPAICAAEFAAVRAVADEASDSVSVAAVCRSTEGDVLQAVDSVAGAPDSRVMVVVPASDAMAQCMTHQRAESVLASARDLIYAAKARNADVAVDICMADASRADYGLMGAAASWMTAAGAGAVLLADTVGAQLPADAAAMFAGVQAAADDSVVVGSHLHNDLGLGLSNTLEALRTGTRVVSSSILGLAERSGLVHTEQLMFLLAHDRTRAAALLGAGDDLWWGPVDLSFLPRLARAVSRETGTPLTVTTPIVGTGVGTISTGTPFVDPQLFAPFDPEADLGIEPTIVLTHLASLRVIDAVAGQLGYRLDRAQARAAMEWVKESAFAANHAVVSRDEFADYLAGVMSAVAV